MGACSGLVSRYIRVQSLFGYNHLIPYIFARGLSSGLCVCHSVLAEPFRLFPLSIPWWAVPARCLSLSSTSFMRFIAVRIYHIWRSGVCRLEIELHQRTREPQICRYMSTGTTSVLSQPPEGANKLSEIKFDSHHVCAPCLRNPDWANRGAEDEAKACPPQRRPHEKPVDVRSSLVDRRIHRLLYVSRCRLPPNLLLLCLL
jgi:hypothetical protein